MSDTSREVDLDRLTPEELATLSERDFRSVVTADLKKDASNERIRGHVPAWITEALLTEHATRRLSALRAMLANVDGQLDLRADAFEAAKATAANSRDLQQATSTYYQAITGSKRFRSALLEALPEAERIVGTRPDRVDALERAIRAHRQATLGDQDFEPSAADQALWAMVPNVTVN